MLEINNLSIKINDRYLVENLSLVLNKNDKLAIVGEEGNGKSTLLKSILGITTYADVTGTVNILGNKIGYLAQNIVDTDLEKSVFDYL